VEYTTAASFPETGNGSLLYLATDSARAYRWVGSQYAEVGPTSVSVNAIITSVAGRTGAVTIAAADVSGLGSLATQSSVAYSSLTGTPSTFAPAAHKASHATGGSDALTASDIGAAASSHTHSASDITTGTVATARLGTGTADSTTVLRGDGAWAAPADSLLRGLFVPPAPTSLTATAGNAQATLSWSAPSVVAQAPITDYVVQFSSNSGSTWTTFADGTSTATSATVTGLTNGTAYVFRVAAVNAVGTGSYTAASSSATPSAGSVVTAITGLQLWLDASDASTLFDATSGGSLVAADGGVARWEDKSGNARHFTQSTSGNRPLRKTGIQNSLAVLRFDGSNDFMSVPSSTAIFKFLHDGDSTVFVVLKPGVVANPDALYWILGNSTDSGSTDEQTGYYLRYDDRTSARADLDDSLVHVVLNGGSPRFVGVAKSALPSNTFSLATVRGDPGNATIASRSQVRRNGGSAITQVTSDTNGATALPTGNATQNMFVGATPGATPSWPLNGDIAEIIMYDTALSDANRADVESYLTTKWAIS
jgi:hypothetical protein